MRVLEATVRYPPAPGGAEAHAAAVVDELRRRGHEVTVATTDLFREVPFERRAFAPEPGVLRRAAFTLGGEAHWVWSPGQWADLARLARRHDVVHAHSYGYGHTVAALAAARAAGVPFVFTPHYHPPWSMEGGARRGRLRAVYDAGPGRWTLREADAVVAVSSGEAALLREAGARRVEVVPNGVDLARFAGPVDPSAFARKAGLDGPYVLYAGRLAKNKGLGVLVDAFARLARDRPSLRLVLAGQDQDQGPQVTARAAERGVANRVVLAGLLDDETYRSALAGCAAFALASEWEAFGLVLVEAMASGRPSVAAAVGGVPDVVEDGVTGFLVPHGNAGALADKLALLIDDPARADAMGAAGRARARRFTWDAHVERLLRAFERLRDG